ncbi:unnamed protein product [Cuscuta campestris]|uniref:DUF1635 domain-containing protein n=1 Tax=Cuscuta campestris TaxID=132261 RepID=A0A484M6J9_9ASTE|nr:unnamed protein product [Cuscuta campestris]
MEDQCSPLFFFHEEEIELKHSLLYTTLELENTILSAQEELTRKDEEILQLRNLVARFVRERDEAMERCRRLGFEKLLLRQQIGKSESNTCSGTPPTNEDLENALCNSSDSEEIVAVADPVRPPPSPPPEEVIAAKFPLPEKGKFLQAVLEAGPLLQTLLLAGPLPRWQHPPPQLSAGDIPPVTISSPRLNSGINKRRAADPASPSSPKHQKVFHQSSLLTCNM